MEEAVKQGAVIEEETAELVINGKNTVAVWDIDKLKGHGGSALHGGKGQFSACRSGDSRTWHRRKRDHHS